MAQNIASSALLTVTKGYMSMALGDSLFVPPHSEPQYLTFAILSLFPRINHDSMHPEDPSMSNWDPKKVSLTLLQPLEYMRRKQADVHTHLTTYTGNIEGSGRTFNICFSYLSRK
ncbi:hypothetical protein FRC02_011837 [Tulasnella sp. 418]|nr:hypothetical protein FRC02_011837 [Tulasnella sp. 418]